METFIEATQFSRNQPRFLPGDAYARLQRELVTNPQRGNVMPGCGGLRKLCIADPRRQKGKRGGARVIYLHLSETGQFLMLAIYGKGRKEDLTPSEKRELREFAQEFKRQTVESARRANKEMR